MFLLNSASADVLIIADPEASVQEQALALVRNLVDGTLNSIDYVIGEDGALLQAIGKQLRSTSKAEVLIQVSIFPRISVGLRNTNMIRTRLVHRFLVNNLLVT